MAELDPKSWDVLEKYCCDLTLTRERYELSCIELRRRVDIDEGKDFYVFEPGFYTRAA